MPFAKRLPILACLLVWSLAAAQARAATSYLLVQAPFGGVSTTFKWEVIYNPGQIITGQDLLNTIFGVPSLSAANPVYTETGPFGGPVAYDISSKGTQAAGYLNYGFGLLVESLTVNSQKVAQDTDSDPGWVYYNAGGTDGGTTTYGSGLWTFANSGAADRPLVDGSYDAWVFGTNDFSDNTVTVSGSDSNTGTSMPNDPLASSFASAIVINLTAAPEPGRALLLLMGCGVVFWRRRRN